MCTRTTESAPDSINNVDRLSVVPRDYPDILWIHESFAIKICEFINDVHYPFPNTWWTKTLAVAQELFNGKGEESDLVDLILTRLPTEIRNEVKWDKTIEALKEKMAYLDRPIINDTLFRGESLLVDKCLANRAFVVLEGSAHVANQIMKSLIKLYYYEFADAHAELPDVLHYEPEKFKSDLDHFFEKLGRIRKQREQLERIMPSLVRRRDSDEPSVADLTRQLAELTTTVDAVKEIMAKQADQIKALEEQINRLGKTIQHEQRKDWRKTDDGASMSRDLGTDSQTPRKVTLTEALINCNPVSAVADPSMEASMMSLEAAQRLGLKISQNNLATLRLLLSEHADKAYVSVRGRFRCNEYSRLMTLPFAVVDEKLLTDVVLGRHHLDMFGPTLSNKGKEIAVKLPHKKYAYDQDED
ncbi:hypothetical protein GGH96_005127 [Coemansia sp. RSA 1972]|nr:hypothetical protein GGH96_005127 [Coemansia sp. RSA 1972]